MASSMLTLVKTAANEIGLNSPNAVISNTDLQVIQLLALINRVGNDLVRNYEFRRITKEHVFQTADQITDVGTFAANSQTITAIGDTSVLSVNMVVSGTGIPPYALIQSIDSATQVTLNMVTSEAGTGTALTFSTQDYSLPSDFDRMISDTQWDRSNHWQNLGPKSSQEWQWLQGGVISTGPRFRFRIFGNVLRLFPAPTAEYNQAFEYVSNYWVLATGGTSPTKSTFTADTDTCIFPDDLMLLGLKFQWYRTKGLDYIAYENDFRAKISAVQAQDEPVGRMSLAPMVSPMLIGPWSIPDGTWPR
jgi:hypothetical protein